MVLLNWLLFASQRVSKGKKDQNQNSLCFKVLKKSRKGCLQYEMWKIFPLFLCLPLPSSGIWETPESAVLSQVPKGSSPIRAEPDSAGKETNPAIIRWWKPCLWILPAFEPAAFRPFWGKGSVCLWTHRHVLWSCKGCGWLSCCTSLEWLKFAVVEGWEVNSWD